MLRTREEAGTCDPGRSGWRYAVVGLACRNRRWAWLTAIGSIVPALIMGVGFFVDRPLPAGFLVTSYSALAVAMALASSALRRQLMPARIPKA